MWANKEMVGFVEWLRKNNEKWLRYTVRLI